MKNVLLGFLSCSILFVLFSYNKVNARNSELLKRIELLEKEQKILKKQFNKTYENLYGFGAKPAYINHEKEYFKIIKEIQTTLDKIQKDD